MKSSKDISGSVPTVITDLLTILLNVITPKRNYYQGTNSYLHNCIIDIRICGPNRSQAFHQIAM